MKRMWLIFLGLLTVSAAAYFASLFFDRTAAVDVLKEHTAAETKLNDYSTAVSGTQGQSASKTNAPEKTQAGMVSAAAAAPSNPDRKLLLMFAGDVLIEDYLENVIRQKGPSGVMEDVKRYFESSDLTFANLEGPVSTRGVKAEDKQFTFRAKPEYLSVLKSAGIHAVSLANNHILDFGTEAMLDTLDYLDKAGIYHAGAGENVDSASKPAYINKKGIKTAFIGTSHVIPFTSWAAGNNRPGVATTYSPARVREEIKKARTQSDIVIVYVHWGEERNPMPVQYQRNLARLYIDDGADLVIGSHPHVLQGLEYYKGKLIAYSLGNFVFTDASRDTMILSVEASTGGKMKGRVIPCRVTDYRPVPVTNPVEVGQFYMKLEELSFGIKIAEDGTAYSSRD